MRARWIALFPFVSSLCLPGCNDSPTGPLLPKVYGIHGVFEELEVSAKPADPSLVVDAVGTPYVAYSTPVGVGFAQRIHSSWVRETVDINCGSLCQALGLYRDTSGDLHLLYQSDGSGDYRLTYASRTQGEWDAGIVDPDGHSGYYGSLAFDQKNQLHLAYFVGYPYYDLRFAKRISGQWSSTDVDSDGATGYSAFLFFESGNPQILYRTSQVGYYRARWVNEGWSISRLDDHGVFIRFVREGPDGVVRFAGVGTLPGSEEEWLLHGTVGEDELIIRGAIDGPGDFAHDPSLALASDGTLWAVYPGPYDSSTYDRSIQVARQHPGGQWERWEIADDFTWIDGLTMVMTSDDRMFVAFTNADRIHASEGQTIFGELILEYERPEGRP